MEQNNSGKGCSIFAVIAIIIIFFALPSACSSGNSQYNKDLHSGIEKMKSGEKMTEGEKNATNDFLDWQVNNNLYLIGKGKLL